MKTILVDAVYTFIIEVNGKFQIFEKLHKLLEQFPQRKILLTGADEKKFTLYGLNNMPYEVFTLHHNPEKSDPKYYKLMLQHFNLRANDVIYFEHSLDALKSAGSVGITSYHYDSEKKDLTALKKFLVDNL